MKVFFPFLVISTMALFSAGCATQEKSVGLGAGIGAGTGVALGAIADPGPNGEFRTRNVIVGGMIGGIGGAIAGNAIYNGEQKARAEGAKDNKNVHSDIPSQPTITQAKVQAIWVDPKVVGNRYVAGHYEWVILTPAHWEE